MSYDGFLYDGFLVVINADGGMNMLFFRTGAAADTFIKSQHAQLGRLRPMVQGFKFADFGADVPLFE